MEVTRDTAWTTLTRYTTSESLLRHALAVEASTRFYARTLGEDEELWGCVALLHDFDYEIHPTLDEHPQDGAPILREEGYPEELIRAVLSHAEHLGLVRFRRGRLDYQPGQVAVGYRRGRPGGQPDGPGRHADP